MYKRGDLGYNSWSMAATPTSLPGPPGKPRTRRGRGGFRALVDRVLRVRQLRGHRRVRRRSRAGGPRAHAAGARPARGRGRRQRTENDRLREQIRRLSGEDPTAIEEIARRELGLIRPGERLFIIRDVTPARQK